MGDYAGSIGAAEKFVDRSYSGFADVVGVFVDVEGDVFAHDIVAHFGGMLAHVGHDFGFVAAGVSETCAYGVLNVVGGVVVDVVTGENGAEWDWEVCG